MSSCNAAKLKRGMIMGLTVKHSVKCHYLHGNSETRPHPTPSANSFFWNGC